ncbi:PilW family protein [Pseudoalteromonas pernae]|uniref:PilW family protein n=1 Tax=Pseudoalteromonas pernae TaxID=3118054 RepID=UPI003242A5EB
MVKSKGFSLVELMLATVLLTLVMYSGYFAYGTYTSSWTKRGNAFWSQVSGNVKIDAIGRMFQGAKAYIVKTQNDQYSIFFNADEGLVQFVTASPIFSDGDAVIELRVVETEDDVNLVYRESPLLDAPLIQQGEVRIWADQFTLLKGYQGIELSFYGWKDYQEAAAAFAQEDDFSAEKSWYKQHTIEEHRILPEIVKLALHKEDSNAVELSFSVSEGSLLQLFSYYNSVEQ